VYGHVWPFENTSSQKAAVYVLTEEDTVGDIWVGLYRDGNQKGVRGRYPDTLKVMLQQVVNKDLKIVQGAQLHVCRVQE
jgi:hypothetical protein